MPCKAHFYFPDSLVHSVRHSHKISAVCLKGSDPLYFCSTVGGILTAKDYEDESGRLFDINSGIGQVQNLSYRYDNLGNLTERKDDLQNKTENFVYDTLNRLTSASVQGVGTKTFAYDAMGNITNKSDVGSYLYGENTNGHAGPHAVTTTSNGNVNTTYAYDSNGNMQSGNGRTIAWSSYNKPTQISKGNNVVSFNYGPDRARYQQVASDNTSVKTTTYIGGLFEKVQTGSNIESKHYIRAGGQVIAIHNTYRNAAAATQFLHRDHLGSVDVITDANQNVTERLSFDAFGQRRQTNWNDAISQITSSTTRGYTGHEQLDSVGLIHMNGRVYDPQLGRFLSADPFVQEPKNFQSLNRYTYVQNNPLSYTDPSGFFFKKLKKAFKRAVKSITNAVKSVVKTLASAAGSILNAVNGIPVVGSAVQAAACSYGPGACAAYTAASTYAATGSLTASLTAGAIAYSMGSVEIFGFSDVPQSDQGLKYGKVAELVLRSAQYDKERKRESGSEKVMRDKSVAGTASSQTGGKFQNGALTTGFQYLYNQVANPTAAANKGSSATSVSNSSNEVQAPEKIKNALEVVLGESVDGVRVIENSKFARLHGSNTTATTRMDRIYLNISGEQFFNRPELVLHEYYHVIKQWNTRELTVPKYLWENATNGNGYDGNRYEVEARSFATQNVDRFRQLIK